MNLVGRLNRSEAPKEQRRLVSAVRAAGALLGVILEDAEAWFQSGAGDLGAEEITALIAQRTQARENKDFATSDQIRDDLLAKGVVLEDGPGGTTWRYQADE
jgi:cysteinyl-tRNA synthetase